MFGDPDVSEYHDPSEGWEAFEDVEALVAWLQSLPEEHDFRGEDPAGCILAQYLAVLSGYPVAAEGLHYEIFCDSVGSPTGCTLHRLSPLYALISMASDELGYDLGHQPFQRDLALQLVAEARRVAPDSSWSEGELVAYAHELASLVWSLCQEPAAA